MEGLLNDINANQTKILQKVERIELSLFGDPTDEDRPGAFIKHTFLRLEFEQYRTAIRKELDEINRELQQRQKNQMAVALMLAGSVLAFLGNVFVVMLKK